MEKSINERIKIQNDKIIKYGKTVSFQEVRNTNFIRNNTNIPVPKIYNYYTKNGVNYIEMEYIKGDTLDNMLRKKLLNERDIDNICQQLKTYVKELRKIKSNYIGSIDKNSVEDILFGKIGPYTETNLNQHIVNIIDDVLHNYYKDLIHKMLLSNHTINLTHGDLTPRNIIINNKKVVALIDWETLAYMPEYWEYVKSRIGVSWDNIWFSKIELFLNPYYYENSVFNMILKAFF